MRIWYVHEARRGWHERNLYLCREVVRSWNEAGHRAGIINTADPSYARSIKEKNAKCDVAFINNFQTLDSAERQGLNLVERSKFRVLITGGGWRRQDWIHDSIKAVSKSKAHLVCLTHTVHHDKFRAVHNRVFHVGLGFDPAVFYPDWGAQRKHIVFCGDEGMGRKRRLGLLAKGFPGLVRSGTTCRLTHAQMAEYLRGGLIGWNQIGSGPEDGVSCNLRVWELAGSGIFQLCSRSKHVPLKDGRHYVSWKSDKDLLDKAQYYLAHNAEREAIARQGYEKAIQKHTWYHRALEYKNLVEKYCG